jgi:hypothetical protein
LAAEIGLDNTVVSQYRLSMPKQRADSREGMIVTTVALPQDLHRRLMLAALEENAAAVEIIRQAVRELLDRREQKGKKGGGR